MFSILIFVVMTVSRPRSMMSSRFRLTPMQGVGGVISERKGKVYCAVLGLVLGS